MEKNEKNLTAEERVIYSVPPDLGSVKAGHRQPMSSDCNTASRVEHLAKVSVNVTG